jgi:hypothetical protein
MFAQPSVYPCVIQEIEVDTQSLQYIKIDDDYVDYLHQVYCHILLSRG